MMSKFKVGDRVKFSGLEYNGKSTRITELVPIDGQILYGVQLIKNSLWNEDLLDPDERTRLERLKEEVLK